MESSVTDGDAIIHSSLKGEYLVKSGHGKPRRHPKKKLNPQLSDSNDEKVWVDLQGLTNRLKREKVS